MARDERERVFAAVSVAIARIQSGNIDGFRFFTEVNETNLRLISESLLKLEISESEFKAWEEAYQQKIFSLN